METTQKKSRWRLFVEWGIFPLALGVFIALIVVWVQDDAHSATPASSPAHQRTCVPPDPDMTCAQWTRHYKRAKVRQFKKGKLGNAAGFKLPRKWRRALDRWAANHEVAARRQVSARGGHWWDWPLESLMCTPIAGAGYRVACDNAEKHYRTYSKKVVLVTVTCSGSAAIGALAGGGAAGAGKGALACLWGHIAIGVLKDYQGRPAARAPDLYAALG